MATKQGPVPRRQQAFTGAAVYLLTSGFFCFCSPLTWIEEKGPGLKRNRHLSFHFKSGSLENVPNVGDNKNIFLKDQTIFVQKLLGQISEAELAAEKKRILHCLWLAEEIQKCCG